MEREKIKVLHVCKVFLPVKGGVQKIVSVLTEALSSHRHTVLSTSNDSGSKSWFGDTIKVIRSRSYAEIASLPIAPMLILRYWKEARNADLVAIHYPFPLADLAVAFSISTPPIIVHWHSEVVAQPRLKWLVSPFTLMLLFRASAIVVTSRKMTEVSWWLKKFSGKVVYIPFGITEVTKEKTGTIPFQTYFLMVGRHVSYKGFDTAIRSMQFHDQNMVVIGNGPLLERHIKLAEQLKFMDRIEFISEASDAGIAGYMRNCTGLVFPSVMRNEAFGLVQIETMRIGKPIINTFLNSSVPWVARDRKEAITVTPGDIDALARAITELADNPNLAEKLGANGRLRYEKMFTMDQFSAAMEKLYLSVVT